MRIVTYLDNSLLQLSHERTASPLILATNPTPPKPAPIPLTCYPRRNPFTSPSCLSEITAETATLTRPSCHEHLILPVPQRSRMPAKCSVGTAGCHTEPRCSWLDTTQPYSYLPSYLTTLSRSLSPPTEQPLSQIRAELAWKLTASPSTGAGCSCVHIWPCFPAGPLIYSSNKSQPRKGWKMQGL